MKRIEKHHVAFAGIFALAVLFISSSSFAALNAYLKLKGQKQGKTYKATPDASGKFKFSDVEPDVYDLTFEVTATDQAGNTGSDSKKISTIEISSFSWGSTNVGSNSGPGSQGGGITPDAAQGKSTPVTRSNISNNRTFTVDAQGPVVTISGVHVATGDVNGDGIADMITSPVKISVNGASDSGPASEIVLKNIMITSISSPSGECKAGYNVKANVK
jgi:hypothetical protein